MRRPCLGAAPNVFAAPQATEPPKCRLKSGGIRRRRFRLRFPERAVQWKAGPWWYVKTAERLERWPPMATYHGAGGRLLAVQYRLQQRASRVPSLQGGTR
jgi:hypothetical protein